MGGVTLLPIPPLGTINNYPPSHPTTNKPHFLNPPPTPPLYFHQTQRIQTMSMTCLIIEAKKTNKQTWNMEQTMLLKNIHDIFNAVPADPLGGFLFFFVRLRQMTPIQNDVPRYSIEKNKPDLRMFPHHCSTLRPDRFSG